MTFPFPTFVPIVSGTWQTLLQPSLDADVYGGFGTYTIVQRVEAAAFAVSGTATKARLTFAADTTRIWNTDSVWIGNAAAAGDAYDAASLEELKFSTASGFSLAIGATVLSDELTLVTPLDLSKALIVSMDWANSGTLGARGKTTLANWATYTKVSMDEGGTANKTGYSAGGSNVCGISKVEVFA